MARNFFSLCLRGARFCAAGAMTLLVWTFWLALALLAAAQVYVASTNELRLPLFVQRAIEDRLAMSGIHINFDHTLFDPTGRILIENVRVTLTGFDEPIMTARAIYCRLDPLALAIREIRPLELRLTGVNLRVPAMLSPSGHADEIVSDLDAAFRYRAGEIAVDYLNCRLGKLPVSMYGRVAQAAFPPRRGSPLPIAEFLAKNYALFSRECAAGAEELRGLEGPALFVRLGPGASRGTTVRVSLFASGLRLAYPTELRASGIRFAGEFPLSGPAPVGSPLFLDVDQLQLPGLGGSAVRGLRAWMDVSLEPWHSGRPGFTVRELRLTAGNASANGVDVHDAIVSAKVSGLTFSTDIKRVKVERLDADARAWLWSQPASAQAQVDLGRRQADLHFRGALGSAALEAVGAALKRDLRRFVEFTQPVSIDGEAHFGAGWIFSRASARVDATGFSARGVRLDEAHANLGFDGHRLVATDSFARIGDNFARGTYEQEVPGCHYRFVLTGRLRPLDITPWIAGAWWNQVFGDVQFPAEPPLADMDLSGCWTDGRQAAVFVSVDSAGAVFRDVAFDRVRTRLFIRPQFDDCLQFSVARGSGLASGTFARRFDLNALAMRSLDFDVTSTLDVGAVAKVLGPASAQLEPFSFEKPPFLQVRGHLDGPAAGSGPHQEVHVRGRTDTALRYHDFPLEAADFTVDVHDSDVVIDPVSAGFAGGRATGNAKVWGGGTDRRLKFDLNLRGANLGRAIEIVRAYTAKKDHLPHPSPGNFVKDKANVLVDVAAAAEGRLGVPYSFQGAGTAQVQGAELGEVRMLGLLSDLFRFTSLRFTSARAAFALDGPRLVFSDVSATGANSGITARGTYAIDRHELNFRARINPFQESRAFPQKFMDMMLTPLSGALEVKLTGTIEKPSWTFANGPTNLLRSLAPPAPGAEKPYLPALSPLNEQP